MVMEDNVLFEDEVESTMRAALDNGLEVTALHNHFFFEQPKIYLMHISGMGDVASLAQAVKKVLDAPDRIRLGQATPATKFQFKPVPAQSHITGAPLEGILGGKGEANNGMFKVTLGRETKMHGVTAGDAIEPRLIYPTNTPLVNPGRASSPNDSGGVPAPSDLPT